MLRSARKAVGDWFAEQGRLFGSAPVRVKAFLFVAILAAAMSDGGWPGFRFQGAPILLAGTYFLVSLSFMKYPESGVGPHKVVSLLFLMNAFVLTWHWYEYAFRTHALPRKLVDPWWPLWAFGVPLVVLAVMWSRVAREHYESLRESPDAWREELAAKGMLREQQQGSSESR